MDYEDHPWHDFEAVIENNTEEAKRYEAWINPYQAVKYGYSDYCQFSVFRFKESSLEFLAIAALFLVFAFLHRAFMGFPDLIIKCTRRFKPKTLVRGSPESILYESRLLRAYWIIWAICRLSNSAAFIFVAYVAIRLWAETLFCVISDDKPFGFEDFFRADQVLIYCRDSSLCIVIKILTIQLWYLTLFFGTFLICYCNIILNKDIFTTLFPGVRTKTFRFRANEIVIKAYDSYGHSSGYVIHPLVEEDEAEDEAIEDSLESSRAHLTSRTPPPKYSATPEKLV